MSDFYTILGIARTANTLEIQKAYRKKARASHPDIVGSADDGEKFRKVQKAYEALSDPVKRQEYDDGESIQYVTDPVSYAQKLWADKL